MTARPDIDVRDPRQPLARPPFGDPPKAAQCDQCGEWYPWKAFYKRAQTRKVGSNTYRTAGHRRQRCLNCR